MNGRDNKYFEFRNLMEAAAPNSNYLLPSVTAVLSIVVFRAPKSSDRIDWCWEDLQLQ